MYMCKSQKGGRFERLNKFEKKLFKLKPERFFFVTIINKSKKNIICRDLSS